jgi:hypothetical protein
VGLGRGGGAACGPRLRRRSHTGAERQHLNMGI